MGTEQVQILTRLIYKKTDGKPAIVITLPTCNSQNKLKTRSVTDASTVASNDFYTPPLGWQLA